MTFLYGEVTSENGMALLSLEEIAKYNTLFYLLKYWVFVFQNYLGE